MRSRGFTLVELIVTLVLLAILAGGVSSYLGIGARIYADAAEREQVLGQSRFVAERLIREIRNAVPGSALLGAANDCLQFLPMLYSGVYTELPFDSSANTMQVISPDLIGISPVTFDTAMQPRVLVYPRNNADVYAEAPVLLAEISSLNATEARFELRFSSTVRFSRQSPERRFYIADQPVVYCAAPDGTGNFNMLRNGVLMAQGLRSNNVFRVSEPVLNRNSVVNLFLQFGATNNPDMFFNYEVHLANVP